LQRLKEEVFLVIEEIKEKVLRSACTVYKVSNSWSLH
jgi:hypothetical protein